MIIEELRRLKKNNYSITVNGESYILDEEIILEYRLVKGKEITEEILAEAAKKNSLAEYYHKALDYSVRYLKGEGATIDYLVSKGLSYQEAKEIVSKLVKNKIISDRPLVEAQIEGLVRRKYGRLYIKEKLRERKFPLELIDEEMGKIDYALYYSNMNSLFNEAKKRYKGEQYIINTKAKKYVLSKGYSFDDLNHLE